MPDRLFTLVRPAFVIGGLLVSGAVAWVTLTNQVKMLRDESATKVEMQAVERKQDALGDAILRELRVQRVMLCRTPQNRNDTHCASQP